MMHYLRERGLFAFVTRYVEREQIPVPKLLLAFGILLVRPRIVLLGAQLTIYPGAISPRLWLPSKTSSEFSRWPAQKCTRLTAVSCVRTVPDPRDVAG